MFLERGLSWSAHLTFCGGKTTQLAMKACPQRSDFYAKIGGDAAKREAWLVALENQVGIIKKQLTVAGVTP